MATSERLVGREKTAPHIGYFAKHSRTGVLYSYVGTLISSNDIILQTHTRQLSDVGERSQQGRQRQMSSLQSRWRKFRNKEYRDAYAAAQFDIELPFQIQALREARSWSCKELAKRSGIPVRSLTKLEETGQSDLITPDILCRLASAFDVGILVQFVSFSDLVYRAESLHPGTFKIVSFDDDALARPKTISQKMDTEKSVYVLFASTPTIRPTYTDLPMIHDTEWERKKTWPDVQVSRQPRKRVSLSAQQRITFPHMRMSSMSARPSST